MLNTTIPCDDTENIPRRSMYIPCLNPVPKARLSFFAVQSLIASAMVKSELRLWFAVPGDGRTM